MTDIQRALLSVSDKTGIVEFARHLAALGIELLSTGGTANLLAENKIPIINIADYIQYPEIMGGRVKTLHPKIYGGLLGRRDKDQETMQQHNIPPIDLLVVNLYPFENTIAKPNCKMTEAIEQIDIGGPSMVRAAAKNFSSVTVVVDTNDYGSILDSLKNNNLKTSEKHRFSLAVKAFEYIANYDRAIANYFQNINNSPSLQNFPTNLNLHFKKIQDLRYGENPHQKAAFYLDRQPQSASIATAQQLQGKELSFNNINDADTALECAKQFSSEPFCVIVKHANPCGAAVGNSIKQAYDKAYQCDPTSAFGGIIAFNTLLDAATTNFILEQQFVEVIIAPAFHPDALSILSNKKNIRVLAYTSDKQLHSSDFDFKRVTSGLLVQQRDQHTMTQDQLSVVTQHQPSENELTDLLFAWKICKYVKSNAIVYSKDRQIIGIGAGQMNRVNSAKIATQNATQIGAGTKGAVMASDAFFPFRDSIDTAADAGISAVIQPGGSIRDNEVISAADDHGLAMVFTGIRHFRH